MYNEIVFLLPTFGLVRSRFGFLINIITTVLTAADMIGLRFKSEETDENLDLDHDSQLGRENENENENEKINKNNNKEIKDISSFDKVEAVWGAVWGHLCCYLLPVDDYTRWFLMDEVSC